MTTYYVVLVFDCEEWRLVGGRLPLEGWARYVYTDYDEALGKVKDWTHSWQSDYPDIEYRVISLEI